MTSRMTDMTRFGSTPLMTSLVFFVGMSLGYAWKTGLLPIELSSPNTGQINRTELSEQSESTATVRESISIDRPDSTDQNLTAGSELDVAEIASQQTEPASEETSVYESVQRRRAIQSEASSIQLAVESNETELEHEQNVESSAARRKHIQFEETQPEVVQQPNNVRQTRRPPVSQAAYLEPDQPAEPRALPDEDRPSQTVPRVATKDEATPKKLAPEKVQPINPELAADLQVIDEQIANGEILAAHRALSKIYWNQKQDRDAIRSRLEDNARKIFFQPQPHFLEPHVIEPNDQLRSIASKHQLSWEYLAKLNRTDPRRIQPGQKLKVVKGPFSAVVDLSDFTLTVHLQGYFVKKYEVGIGKDGSSPLGKFPVLNKVENPQYTGPDGKVIPANDPANPLGERWLDLGNSYGIHGTIEPDSIGTASSRGCIRMRDRDVIEVYDFLVKGSEVTIRE